MKRTHHDDELDHQEGARPSEVRDDGVRVGRVKDDPGVVEARRRFGGLDWLATLAGLLAAIGSLVLLGGLVGAAGTIGYQLDQLNASGEDLSIGGLIAGLVVLLLAFFIGGWVAGRVARYDGGRNGVMAVIWFLLLAGLLSALGAFYGDRYDVFSRFELPQWFSADDAGTAAIISAVVGALVALVAGWLGGTVGARYHRRADALVTRTRAGGIARPQVVNEAVAGPRDRDPRDRDPQDRDPRDPRDRDPRDRGGLSDRGGSTGLRRDR